MLSGEPSSREHVPTRDSMPVSQNMDALREEQQVANEQLDREIRARES